MAPLFDRLAEPCELSLTGTGRRGDPHICAFY